MISEMQKKVLREHRLPVEVVEAVESFNEQTGEVVFKDGTERRIAECWCRAMGFYRPVSDFNAGKRSEYDERVCFTAEKAGIND